MILKNESTWISIIRNSFPDEIMNDRILRKIIGIRFLYQKKKFIKIFNIFVGYAIPTMYLVIKKPSKKRPFFRSF